MTIRINKTTNSRAKKFTKIVRKPIFRLNKKLAEGAHGITYFSTNLKTGKKICLKISKDNLKETKEAFRREIRVFKKVGKHERILNMISHGKGSLNSGRKMFWIATDYCKNGDLMDMLMKKGAPLQPD